MLPTKGERIVRGVSAAPGMAVGRAAVVGGESAASGEQPVSAANRAAELIKARQAMASAAAELEAIADSLRKDGRAEDADIIETGVLMAHDPGLEASLERLVTESGMSAQAALREAAEGSARELASLDDPMLAERAEDVRSLGRRAAARAAGVSKNLSGGVLVADNLGPAEVAELSGIQGVALARGGITAHAAIVARSLGLPMVVGLGSELLQIAEGEEVVLDGDAAHVVRFPSPARLVNAFEAIAVRQSARRHAVAHRDKPAVTVDGHRVSILANAASVPEVVEALEQGAEGVGLLRTELLFLEASSWPTQAQHVRFLAPILAELAGRIATVRLLDFGGDKTPPFLRGTRERGVELLLRAPEALRGQLAAVLEAGARTRLRILVPMITTAAQVREVRAALTAVLDGRPTPKIGAMVETPDAARGAAGIAKEVDFLSIGTNDLTQMVLGLDREKSKSAPVTDVRVLRLIDATMRAGRDAAIPVDVCGEAASDAAAMPILVGLGASELSVAAARVGEVRERVRALRYDECEKLAAAALLGQVADARRERV